MVASEFLDFLTKFQVTSYVGVEDFADKFNFHFTVIVLLVLTLVVTVKQYVLKPISCYLATDIGGKNLLSYLENYCWVQGTIPISYDGNIPQSEPELAMLENEKILYYQWVPFALGIQCIMFYLPRLLWQVICYNHTGTDIQHLIASANQAVHSSDEAKSKMVVYVAKTIAQTCFQHREYREGYFADIRRKLSSKCSFLIISKRFGTKIVTYYIILKFIYLTNGLFQLYLMQCFLGITSSKNSVIFGVDVISNIFHGKDWTESLVFPRVGFCFVPLNHLGSLNTVAAQCVLPVNMLNERIYFFLWCWILIGVVITLICIPLWLYRICGSRKGYGFIKNFLLVKEAIENDEKHDDLLNDFENQFLRHDGLFILKMLSINAGDIIAADIIAHLWEIFKKNYAPVKGFDDSTDNGTVPVSDNFSKLDFLTDITSKRNHRRN